MRTLCLEMAPTYLRGMVIDEDGRASSDRRRVELRRSASPKTMLDALDELLADILAAHDEARNGPAFGRASIAFPGLVWDGGIVTAPGFTEEWQGVRLTGAVEFRLGVPTRAATDADVLGLAVVEGSGVEMVLTFGVRLGTALFVNGHLCPGLDLGRHPFARDETYDDRLGNTARKRIGNDKWNRRLQASLMQLHPIFNYTRIYLGGPNVDKIDVPSLPDKTRVVDGSMALRGGLHLWTSS